jgi:hypothetical protein
LASSVGIPCPGCGLTRATFALLHGDLPGALHFHPLVWLLLPIVLYVSAQIVIELMKSSTAPQRSRRRLLGARGTNLLATFVLVATLTVWLARFAGHFGGPVQVTTLREWLGARR